MDQINWQKTRDILLSIVCLGIIFYASWVLLGQFVDAIITFLLAMTVAFLLTPIVNFLGKHGVPRLLATVITYVVVLGAIIGLAYELIFSLVLQVNTFSTTITNFAFSLPTTFNDLIKQMLKVGITYGQIHSAIAQLQSQMYSFATDLAGNVIDIVSNGVNVFVDVFLVTVLSFYLTLDGKRIRDNMIKIAPQAWLPHVLLFEDALYRVVGNYIRGQLTLAVLIGLGTSCICLVSGLGDYALICGVLAFLFETIPMVGPALASIMPILLSLLLGEPQLLQRTVLIVVLFIIMQTLESNVLGPRIVGHAVGLHPVAAILSLLVGAQLFGIFGALLATPVVAAAWVVIASLYRSAHGETADQILAHRREPWSLRHPLFRPKKIFTRSGKGKTMDQLRARVHVDERLGEKDKFSYRHVLHTLHKEPAN
ncbi:AI-2E family transporter [Dictyobacter arantiisoli]|uniref:AI-2E family transporter n=1 Tax=Dictyobacter arantiisoli TaxID=2014874 RepID=A0A5A5T5I3_9CHLR|nr:AI-2E family transporter [Dictyobacter arantiisoli]GCF06612.1 AI-2E family transporter [Dictyobacter arantiisoli]